MPTRNILLLADDMASNRAFLRRLFENDYNLLEAEDGEQTLQRISEHHEQIAAVILDLIMPVKDGYQVLTEMKKAGYLSEIPVIVVTSDGSQKSEARALELGALDLLTKPYDPYIIKRRVQNLVELNLHRQMLASQVGEMAEVIQIADDSIVNTLATITEFRSLESGQHILRIRKFAEILLTEVARSFPEYDLDERAIDTISSAAVLHDIGKISIPDSILNKPGKLTSEEFQLMKNHTIAGCEILKTMTQVVDREYMHYAYNICRYHHERWDGRGYPDGLRGENIPICAQVVSIADVYDALTTKRVYKDAISHEDAVNMILNGQCGIFNPRLLECFKRVRVPFAECAKSYTDHPDAAMQDIHVPAASPKSFSGDISAQQMSTIKYYTLLNYVNEIVVEIDMLSDTYHVVYDTNRTFAGWVTDTSFQNVIVHLIKHDVHPEDRAHVWQTFSYFEKSFFAEGLRRYSQKFRLRTTSDDTYFWIDCSFLRLDVGDPAQHKALMVWKQVDDRSAHLSSDPLGSYHDWETRALYEMMGAFFHCRNDKWQTMMDGHSQLSGLLGYSEEEFEQNYHNRLIEAILPEDRGSLLSNVYKQLNRGSIAEAEYRLLGKNGRIVWVKDRACVFSDTNGTEYVCHAIMDNTHVQESLEQLHSTRERHQILLEQIDEIAFEWNISKDTVTFSSNFKKQFGYEPVCVGLAQAILDGNAKVHPDDLYILQNLVRSIRNRQKHTNSISGDIRIQAANGTYLWRRLRAGIQQMENGRLECIIGVLIDVETDKYSPGHPNSSDEQDSLTKLYNKQAARVKVEEYIQERHSGDRSSLLLIDLDRFHEINEHYGRMAGDAVLLQATALLRKFFRRNDIIARIGGDEFLVLVKDISSSVTLQSQCTHFIETFTREISKEIAGNPLSCSVGAALMPEDGNSFEELFERAEQALFHVKHNHPGTFAFYHRTEQVPATKPITYSPIESDEILGLADQSLAFYAFNHLYQSGNVEKTIETILEMVGRQMNVSRVYICENSPDNRFCSNTFEWCNKGISPQKEFFQNISYATDIPGWVSHYNAQDIFLCEDVSQLPGEYRSSFVSPEAKSMLQCAIMDGNVFRGYVGLDECRIERTWTREQVDVLSMVARLTSVFLLKKRVQDISSRENQSLITVLENSLIWIYVIDPDTCEILFSNSKIQASFPQIRMGCRCYESMMNRNQRCENCVAADIREKKHASVEIEHPDTNMHIQAEATLINWNGREAALIMCNVLPNLKHS